MKIFIQYILITLYKHIWNSGNIYSKNIQSKQQINRKKRATLHPLNSKNL